MRLAGRETFISVNAPAISALSIAVGYDARCDVRKMATPIRAGKDVCIRKEPGCFTTPDPRFPVMERLFQPERHEQRLVDAPVDHQSVVALVTGDRVAAARAYVAIDGAVVVSSLGQARLNIAFS